MLNKPWILQGYHTYYLVFLFFVGIILCVQSCFFCFYQQTRRGSGWKSCYQRIWHILRWMTNKSETDVFTHQDLNILQRLWFSIQENSEIYYQWQCLFVHFFHMFSYSCFSHQLFTWVLNHLEYFLWYYFVCQVYFHYPIISETRNQNFCEGLKYCQPLSRRSQCVSISFDTKKEEELCSGNHSLLL